MEAMGKQRLLIASQPLDAGVPHHVLDVVRGLDRDRFALTVATPRESVLWQELVGDPGVELHPIGPHRKPSPFGDLRSFAQLARLVARADIVHGHSAKAGFLSRLAAAATRRTRRCVFTPHGWSFWAAEGRTQQLYLALERQAADWCKTIVAVGQFERDAGLEAGIGTPEQYAVVANGVDVSRFALPRRPRAGRVVMVGRIAPPKRHDLAVEAMVQVRSVHPDAELHIIGDGPGRPALEARISALSAWENVRLLGARDDIPALLAEAEVLLLASDYEGAPLSVLEAMAAGVPVVASAVAGIPELVIDGETGVLVEPGSAAAIGEAISALLGAPARAAELGAGGKVRARDHYSRERMIRDLTAVYDAVLEGRS